jgi:hypothetical protein
MRAAFEGALVKEWAEAQDGVHLPDPNDRPSSCR